VTKVLYSASKLAEALGMTKQGVNKAAKEGRIEEPLYKIGNINGWTFEQIERIKKGVRRTEK
jgi:hypothetical protein